MLRHVSSLTIRHIVILIILLVILANTAQGASSDPGRWVFDLFRHSTQVQLFEDGSGVAAGPEGETIRFCVDGELCDDREQRLRADTPHRVMLPIIQQSKNSDQVITVTRRRTN